MKSKLKATYSVLLAYAIRVFGKILTITFGLIGSVLIAICAFTLGLVFLLAKPFEWIQRARHNAIGK
mgnify:CR=1 FL=1